MPGPNPSTGDKLRYEFLSVMRLESGDDASIRRFDLRDSSAELLVMYIPHSTVVRLGCQVKPAISPPDSRVSMQRTGLFGPPI